MTGARVQLNSPGKLLGDVVSTPIQYEAPLTRTSLNHWSGYSIQFVCKLAKVTGAFDWLENITVKVRSVRWICAMVISEHTLAVSVGGIEVSEGTGVCVGSWVNVSVALGAAVVTVRVGVAEAGTGVLCCAGADVVVGTTDNGERVVGEAAGREVAEGWTAAE
jgi:hypothetical protein